MTPADAAAFTALDLAPGSPWPLVQAAWRDLVKRHHPDGKGLWTDHDAHRLREVNAAYAHLCRQVATVQSLPGRLVCSRRGTTPPKALWDLVWDPREWGTWMPGVRHAERVLGTCDHRRSVTGNWAGHRFSLMVLLTSVTPPCKLTGRVLELRVDGRPVDLGAPPRISIRLSAVGTHATDVELAITLPSGRRLPEILQAALQAALVELLDLASPLALPEGSVAGRDWPQAA
jgi:hypothetical protein